MYSKIKSLFKKINVVHHNKTKRKSYQSSKKSIWQNSTLMKYTQKLGIKGIFLHLTKDIYKKTL